MVVFLPFLLSTGCQWFFFSMLSFDGNAQLKVHKKITLSSYTGSVTFHEFQCMVTNSVAKVWCLEGTTATIILGKNGDFPSMQTWTIYECLWFVHKMNQRKTCRMLWIQELQGSTQQEIVQGKLSGLRLVLSNNSEGFWFWSVVGFTQNLYSKVEEGVKDAWRATERVGSSSPFLVSSKHPLSSAHQYVYFLEGGRHLDHSEVFLLEFGNFYHPLF